jgi:hypothetical protein
MSIHAFQQQNKTRKRWFFKDFPMRIRLLLIVIEPEKSPKRLVNAWFLGGMSQFGYNFG